MITYTIPAEFDVGGGVADHELLGVAQDEATGYSVDVATQPGYVAIRSSREFASGRRSPRRAWLSPADARELASLLLDAAALVEEQT